jgi:hypothetical protein
VLPRRIRVAVGGKPGVDATDPACLVKRVTLTKKNYKARFLAARVGFVVLAPTSGLRRPNYISPRTAAFSA